MRSVAFWLLLPLAVLAACVLATPGQGPGTYGASASILVLLVVVMAALHLPAPMGCSKRGGERCDCKTGGPCLAERGELPAGERCVEGRPASTDHRDYIHP